MKKLDKHSSEGRLRELHVFRFILHLIPPDRTHTCARSMSIRLSLLIKHKQRNTHAHTLARLYVI